MHLATNLSLRTRPKHIVASTCKRENRFSRFYFISFVTLRSRHVRKEEKSEVQIKSVSSLLVKRSHYLVRNCGFIQELMNFRFSTCPTFNERFLLLRFLFFPNKFSNASSSLCVETQMVESALSQLQ